MSEYVPPLKLQRLQPLYSERPRRRTRETPAMSYLHLPAEHSEADLVLAANLADFVGSEDLYVAWTHRDGAGAVPEVEAILRDERPSLLAELFAGRRGGS